MLKWFRIFNMFICNSRQICRKRTQRVSWINKFVKFRDDIALVHLAGCYLNQIIINSRQTSRFYVKDNISGFSQLHIYFIVSNGHTIFNNIGFHAINQLNLGFFSSFITMRKTLHIAVVSNRNCFMPPLRSCRNQIFDFW